MIFVAILIAAVFVAALITVAVDLVRYALPYLPRCEKCNSLLAPNDIDFCIDHREV